MLAIDNLVFEIGKEYEMEIELEERKGKLEYDNKLLELFAKLMMVG